MFLRYSTLAGSAVGMAFLGYPKWLLARPERALAELKEIAVTYHMRHGSVHTIDSSGLGLPCWVDSLQVDAYFRNGYDIDGGLLMQCSIRTKKNVVSAQWMGNQVWINGEEVIGNATSRTLWQENEKRSIQFFRLNPTETHCLEGQAETFVFCLTGQIRLSHQRLQDNQLCVYTSTENDIISAEKQTNLFVLTYRS
jgi:hypothetical protein